MCSGNPYSPISSYDAMKKCDNKYVIVEGHYVAEFAKF